MQSFNMTNDKNPACPGYNVGSLVLLPWAMKDVESVGLCTQVFTIVSRVKGALSRLHLVTQIKKAQYGSPKMPSIFCSLSVTTFLFHQAIHTIFRSFAIIMAMGHRLATSCQQGIIHFIQCCAAYYIYNF